MPAGGGLLQLVATGKQDLFLTGNPQISFFKMVYRRHTNFATESQPMYFDGTPNFGQRISCLIPRRGDLLGRVYLDVTLPRIYDTSGNELQYTNSVGHALIQEITFEVGEQEIDRQTGEWMQIWEQLTTSASQQQALNNMIGAVDGYQPPDLIPGPLSPGLRLYVPLQFYFCRNPGLYLPLLALQYHPIRINITIAPLNTLFWNGNAATSPKCVNNTYINPANITSMMLWGDYVYLDVEERRRMAQESHEYLIEQTQFNEDKGLTSAQNRVDLTFNHPVKELIWVTQQSTKRNCRLTGGAISPLEYDDIIYDCALQLNGQDRMQALPGKYFSVVQPFQHHSGIASDGVYAYSFAIKPEEHQPSGTCNFSRIDSATLVFSVDGSYTINNLDANNYDIRVYAINYNILRVMSGMGGLAYSN